MGKQTQLQDWEQFKQLFKAWENGSIYENNKHSRFLKFTEGPCFSVEIWSRLLCSTTFHNFLFSPKPNNCTAQFVILFYVNLHYVEIFSQWLGNFPFIVPRRWMVSLLMCWAHTRDQIQRKVVLSNLQAITATLLSSFSWRMQCCSQYSFHGQENWGTKRSARCGISYLEVTNFNMKEEGEERETVSGGGFGKLVIGSLFCNSPTPVDAVQLKVEAAVACMWEKALGCALGKKSVAILI